MIDGVEYAGETMIVALGITEDGTKRILGLRQGATENAAVCVALLEDLQARGLDTSRPTLLVLDGSKALHAAATRVWGDERRDPAVPGPQDVGTSRPTSPRSTTPSWSGGCRRRTSETDYETAKASLEATARWLDAAQPRRGGEPAGGPGGDADGGAAGPAGGVAADAGDDQPDRVGAVGDAAGDGAGDPLA